MKSRVERKLHKLLCIYTHKNHCKFKVELIIGNEASTKSESKKLLYFGQLAVDFDIPLTRVEKCFLQKAEKLDEPKDKPKAKKATKSKYEELPEIPDYERPALEKYDKSDFDPNKKVKIQPETIFASFIFRLLIVDDMDHFERKTKL